MLNCFTAVEHISPSWIQKKKKWLDPGRIYASLGLLNIIIMPPQLFWNWETGINPIYKK